MGELAHCLNATLLDVYRPMLLTLKRTFDFFGEFDSVRIGEGARLFVDVVDVQNFTHELNDWLCFVKGRGGH